MDNPIHEMIEQQREKTDMMIAQLMRFDDEGGIEEEIRDAMDRLKRADEHLKEAQNALDESN